MKAYEISQGTDISRLVWLESGTVREILQSVSNIIQTAQGEVPLYRDFGIDASVVDKPTSAVPPLIRAKMREQIETYEPRARVETIDVEASVSEPQRLEVKVRITILGL